MLFPSAFSALEAALLCEASSWKCRPAPYSSLGQEYHSCTVLTRTQTVETPNRLTIPHPLTLLATKAGSTPGPFEGTSTHSHRGCSCHSLVASCGLGLKLFGEPHQWLCQEPFSEILALLLYPGHAFSETMVASFPSGSLSHPLPRVKQPSSLPSPWFLPRLLCPVCCLFSTSPWSLREVFGSGVDWEKTNK